MSVRLALFHWVQKIQHAATKFQVSEWNQKRRMIGWTRFWFVLKIFELVISYHSPFLGFEGPPTVEEAAGAVTSAFRLIPEPPGCGSWLSSDELLDWGEESFLLKTASIASWTRSVACSLSLLYLGSWNSCLPPFPSHLRINHTRVRLKTKLWTCVVYFDQYSLWIDNLSQLV